MESIEKTNISSLFTLVQTRCCSEGAWVANRHLMINRSEIKAVKLKNHLYIVWCNSQFHVVHRIIWCVAVYGLVNNWQTWTRNICLISDIYERWSRKKTYLCVKQRFTFFHYRSILFFNGPLTVHKFTINWRTSSLVPRNEAAWNKNMGHKYRLHSQMTHM